MGNLSADGRMLGMPGHYRHEATSANEVTSSTEIYKLH